MGVNMAQSFLDLDVYQNLYKAMLAVSVKIIPILPREERFSLSDIFSYIHFVMRYWRKYDLTSIAVQLKIIYV